MADKPRIGVVHSVFGENDGVSIVIDQSIEALKTQLAIPDRNISLLGARAPEAGQALIDPGFWHKSPENQYILRHYQGTAPSDLDEFILTHAKQAQRVFERFLHEFKPDVVIVHNGCHPSNFIYGVGIGMAFEDLRARGRAVPKHLVWWHDSHLERERFAKPNPVIHRWLRYLPGKHLDGAVFINSDQARLAQDYFREIGMPQVRRFIEERAILIPNTSDIPWPWRKLDEDRSAPLAPAIDAHDRSFFENVGVASLLQRRGIELEDTFLLLQHTRVVARKRIDHAIDFAVGLARHTEDDAVKRGTVLLVSGEAGDEHDDLIPQLGRHLEARLKESPSVRDRVFVVFIASHVGSRRSKRGARPVHRFRDIPGIVARHGGLGTYFSEVEGYGNNLLEMISMGLPVVVNRYPVFKKDIEPLGFHLPAAEDGRLTDDLFENARVLLTDPDRRRKAVRHNLEILEHKLSHRVLADSLRTALRNVLTQN